MTRVLVIEDTATVRSEIVAALGFEGYEVLEAENGRIGLELAKLHHPDVVVCDLMMPELDGMGTLAALRADPALKTVPFIFLTARADRTGVRQGMEAGADDYVTKPFTVDELLGAINGALERKARADQEADEKVSTLRQQLSLSLPHELGTPLNVIMGYAELLAQAGVSVPLDDVNSCAHHILGAARRLHRLTQNFLLFAQLELLARDGGEPVVYSGPTYLLHETVGPPALERARAAQRERDLELRLCEGALAIEQDAVEKIVTELVDNAFKFSAPGSPVVVEGTHGDDRVEIRVCDAGHGMTHEQLVKISGYNQFERQRWEQQGMGLGLSIARGIARLWGGDLAIESAPDRGTTVRVILPGSSSLPTPRHPRAAGAA